MNSSAANGEFGFPKFSEANQSLLKKYLTPEIYERLRTKTSENGFDLTRLIHSGVQNQDSSIGVYAGDMDSYSIFSELLLPVIYEYHGYSEAESHSRDFSPFAGEMGNSASDNQYIQSTRIRVGRNLSGFPLGPCISLSQRNEVESLVAGELGKLDGELSGTYYSLYGMTDEKRKQLIADHLLFKEGDRFLDAAGLNRDWPDGRGIFINTGRTFLVWINEEDQLRIISMEAGGDIAGVYNRLSKAVLKLETALGFLYDRHLGYISSCPTNLGTAMRASVHIKLPHLAQQMANFKTKAAGLNLQIRGVHGEHSKSEGGVFDVSNKRRLGISEKECVQELYTGVCELIRIEKSLA